VLAGIRRTKGMGPGPEVPLLTAVCRDRARRSKLSALDVGDLEDRPEGMAILLRHSRVDQGGARGRRKVLVYGSAPLSCPVTAARAWMARTAIASGPVFRPVDRHGRLGPGRLSGQGVAAVVKRSALAAGLDPAFFAGHSLRAGRSPVMCGRPTSSAIPRPDGWGRSSV